MEASQLLLDMTLKAWHQQIARAEKFFDALNESDFEKEIAPGKNRLVYILGHLVASNDSLMTLYGFGPRLYPGYTDVFLSKPDRELPTPPISEIRKAWKDVHQTLAQRFATMTVEEWLDKHTAMSAEDLSKEPTRNKLSVMISRTGHVAYHLGQVVLTK